jgi:hypothetical protein
MKTYRVGLSNWEFNIEEEIVAENKTKAKRIFTKNNFENVMKNSPESKNTDFKECLFAYVS